MSRQAGRKPSYGVTDREVEDSKFTLRIQLHTVTLDVRYVAKDLEGQGGQGKCLPLHRIHTHAEG